MLVMNACVICVAMRCSLRRPSTTPMTHSITKYAGCNPLEKPSISFFQSMLSAKDEASMSGKYFKSGHDAEEINLQSQVLKIVDHSIIDFSQRLNDK